MSFPLLFWGHDIGYRTHPGNAGWVHLKVLNLIISSKGLYLNKVTFRVPRVEEVNIFPGSHISTHCKYIETFELWYWRRLLRVPWTARRSKQSILKEISPGCSLEGLMLKLKPILWPPDSKNWLIWKDLDAGKDWGQEEKGTIEDEMVQWHHQLNGHGFGWTLGVGDGKGGLACCGSWGCKESDMTEQLNWLILKQPQAIKIF